MAIVAAERLRCVPNGLGPEDRLVSTVVAFSAGLKRARFVIDQFVTQTMSASTSSLRQTIDSTVFNARAIPVLQVPWLLAGAGYKSGNTMPALSFVSAIGWVSSVSELVRVDADTGNSIPRASVALAAAITASLSTTAGPRMPACSGLITLREGGSHEPYSGGTLTGRRRGSVAERITGDRSIIKTRRKVRDIPRCEIVRCVSRPSGMWLFTGWQVVRRGGCSCPRLMGQRQHKLSNNLELARMYVSPP